jgi:hypothetical protein
MFNFVCFASFCLPCGMGGQFLRGGYINFITTKEKQHMKSILSSILIFPVAIGLFVMTTFGAIAAYADVVLIANPSAASKTLTKAEVKKIFLGKKVIWEDDQEIKLTIGQKGSTNKEFLRTFVNKSESQFERYWRNQVFTGKGFYPKSLKTNAEIIAYVAQTNGAIGYISSETSPEGVNVIKIKDN